MRKGNIKGTKGRNLGTRPTQEASKETKENTQCKNTLEENKANKPHSRQGHKGIIAAYRNVLELPSARELRKIICSKRNSKRKGRSGSTDIHLVSYIYRTSIDSENREDRVKPTFRSRGGKILPSKRNLKRKSRNGSTDVYLLQRTIELEID